MYPTVGSSPGLSQFTMRHNLVKNLVGVTVLIFCIVNRKAMIRILNNQIPHHTLKTTKIQRFLQNIIFYVYAIFSHGSQRPSRIAQSYKFETTLFGAHFD